MASPSTAPIDDLTFLVACKIAELTSSEQQQSSSSSSPSNNSHNHQHQQLTTEHFVKTLQNLAMTLHVPWEHIQQRLAWEHVRQYCAGVNVPSTRHHIYLLIKRHCPDEMSNLPERLSGLSPTQLLDVLVLLDEAFGGSGQAASCVGDGFREVLLRNSVLERENAELSMQLRSVRDKPKAQQNEAAFLVADLQQKLYEALGTMQTMMSSVAATSKKEPRNFGVQVQLSSSASSDNNNSNSSSNNNNQQRQIASNNNNNNTVVVPQNKCDHIPQIKNLEKKLEESLQRELAAKQEMLTRISQYSSLANSISVDNSSADGKNPLEGCKHISIQTDPDIYLTRLQKERKLLLERLASATEILKGSTAAANNNNTINSRNNNNLSMSMTAARR